jgi:hypothetical protein
MGRSYYSVHLGNHQTKPGGIWHWGWGVSPQNRIIRIPTSNYYYINIKSKRTVQLSGIALGYGLDDSGFETWQGLRIFLFTTASRPVLTQPPIKWVPGPLTRGWSGQGVKLTTRLHLVQRSRMRGAVPPLSQYAFMTRCSVIAQGQL